MAFGGMGSKGMGFGRGGGLGGASSFLRPVTDRTSLPTIPTQNTGTVGGGTATQFQSASAHIIRDAGPITNLVMRFANVTGNPAAPAQIIDGPSALTLRVGVKLQTGLFYRAFWADGSVDKVLQPGEMADCTVPNFPAIVNAHIPLIIRRGTYASVPTYWPGSGCIHFGASEVQEFGTALADRTLTGAFSGLPTNVGILPPVAVMTRGPKVSRPAVLIEGDGIGAYGANDTGETITYSRQYGYMQRALSASSIPWAIVGSSGVSLNFANTTADFNKRYSLFDGCGFNYTALCGGESDIGSGGSSAAVQTILTQLQAKYDTKGLKAVTVPFSPRTDSTNTAKTPADGVGVWAQRILWNNYLRTNPLGYGFFDLAASTQDAVDNNFWSAGPIEPDGIHITSARHTTAKADLIAVLSTLFV